MDNLAKERTEYKRTQRTYFLWFVKKLGLYYIQNLKKLGLYYMQNWVSQLTDRLAFIYLIFINYC